MNDQDPLSELRNLIAVRCDGELTPEQAERLKELVSKHPACRSFYYKAMLLHVYAPLDADDAVHPVKRFLDRAHAPGDHRMHEEMQRA